MAKVTVTFEDEGEGLSIVIDPPDLFTVHPLRATPAQVVAMQALLFIKENNEIREARVTAETVSASEEATH